MRTDPHMQVSILFSCSAAFAASPSTPSTPEPRTMTDATPPYNVTQLEHTVEFIGRQNAASKRRIRWVFNAAPSDGSAPHQHELVFTWSVSSGKQDITLDGANVSFSRQKGRSVFNEKVQRMGAKPDLRIVCTTAIPSGSPPDFVLYELVVDEIPYRCCPVAPNGQGRQEVYMGGSAGDMRPPQSILDITDPGRFEGAGGPDYVPGGSAVASAGGAPAQMDATNEEHHVGFRTVAEGDNLSKHEYERHRHDYPKTHFPGTEGGAPGAAPAAPPESVDDLLSFDAPAPASAPAAAAAAPTCDGMMDGVATGMLVPTQQPQSPTSYANDLLAFGAAAPAPAGESGHVAFSSLTPGDDLNNHEYDQHQHGQYPKDHWPGTAGAPPAKPVDPHVGFQTVTSNDDLNRHDYEQHQHGQYPKTHWVAGGDATAAEDATMGGVPAAAAPTPVAGVNPFDQFAAAPPPAGGTPSPQQQQQPPAGEPNDLLGFP